MDAQGKIIDEPAENTPKGVIADANELTNLVSEFGLWCVGGHSVTEVWWRS